MKTNNAEVNEQTVKGLEERLRQILSVPVSHSDRHRRRRRGRGGTQTDGPEGEQCGERMREIGRENEGEGIEIELMTPTSRYKNKGTNVTPGKAESRFYSRLT